MRRIHHVIDYLGTASSSLAAGCLVLFTSLGGTTYPWGSPRSSPSAVAGVVFTGIFALVERRATEPVLPLHLFSDRTFSVANFVGFIVGFAMFGSITYLPLFFQIVRGESPTISGLQLLPLDGGLLFVSIGSGQIISRTGRYRIFPIVGTFGITLGLFLLSRMGIATSTAAAAALHGRARPGTRRSDAGARARRPERRPLLRARGRHLGRHVLPVHRRLVRRCDLRGHLLQRARRQSGEASPRRPAAERPELLAA